MNRKTPPLLLAAAAFFFATPATAQSISVADFLTRAEALEKRGMLGFLSDEANALKAELQAAGKALRTEQNAAAGAGRKPPTCMPPKAGVNPKELLGYFRQIPPPQRATMTLKDGLAGLVRRKYPCPA